ncbi:ComF family protein [Crocosphaera sp. XPORK-15E]|uniref:ComF family protein n=1 Tax=Crocosphaera sp. XPORK-15E TaxID=3110247 RepID=UPI002B2205AC|nr:ComF family protein [Crocosphaera sp. XPORK-15E]MEA5535054.1 ComF family protein [Crocosphaera sp. XPORK-15E]
MLKNILSIFLKENCPLCQRSTDEEICYDCQRQLKSCQLKHPKKLWQGELPLFAWGKYEGKLKQAIAALKYENNPQIGEFLGFWLGETWLKYTLIKTQKTPTIIPIPLHLTKEKERGFNQSDLIAKGFCQITKYPLKTKGLIRIRQTEAMFGLTPEQRKANIQQAFSLGKSLQNHPLSTPILLIDDIYTTGTTAKEAAKVLSIQGFKVLGIIAVSTTQNQSLNRELVLKTLL